MDRPPTPSRDSAQLEGTLGDNQEGIPLHNDHDSRTGLAALPGPFPPSFPYTNPLT